MDDWITTAEAARLTGYDADTIRRLIRSGAIAARKFGPVWMVKKSAALAYARRMAKAGEKRGRKPQ